MPGSTTGGGTTASGAGGGRCSGCLSIPGSICGGGAGGARPGVSLGGAGSVGGEEEPGSAMAGFICDRERISPTGRIHTDVLFMLMADPP